MKFENLNYQLLDLSGDKATQTTVKGYNQDGTPKAIEEIPLTLGYALKTAFNFKGKDETVSFEDMVKRGNWCLLINKGESPSFDSAEQKELKDLILKAGFNPIVIAQINSIIENKGKTIV